MLIQSIDEYITIATFILNFSPGDIVSSKGGKIYTKMIYTKMIYTKMIYTKIFVSSDK